MLDAAARGAPTHEILGDLIVDVAEAESAVADACQSQQDDDLPELEPWRELAANMASAYCAGCCGDGAGARWFLERAREAAQLATERPVVARVEAKPLEGFAFYGLYPEQYINAAEQLSACSPPRRVFCLGLRAIGSMLAHVFAATLRRRGVIATVYSARPRGHPFNRTLVLTKRLQRTIHDANADVYAVVDEGPGLSGSIFAAAAEAIANAGVHADHIVLIPSWEPDAERLNSPRGRAAWQRHRRVVGAFRPHVDHDRDLSAGKWRDYLGLWPAVQPQHERQKYLQGGHTVARFAGLGKYGRQKLSRARKLASAGFGPHPLSVANGFLTLEWIPGRPLAALASSSQLDRIATYLAFLRQQFAMGIADDIGELASMLMANAQEAGVSLDGEKLSAGVRACPGERIAVDGRMLRHEWIVSSEHLKKVDGLDHFADDFFPGCRDIAWDVAGAIVEFELDDDATTALLTAYRRGSGDRSIARRLPFYEAAYLAYRMGYARLAGEAMTGTDEAPRFEALFQRYKQRLGALAAPD